MFHKTSNGGNAKPFVEILMSLVNKLPSIIRDDGVWQIESANYAFLHKCLNYVSCDRGQGLNLYPFSKVIHYDQEILILSLLGIEWVDDIYFPLSKWL